MQITRFVALHITGRFIPVAVPGVTPWLTAVCPHDARVVWASPEELPTISTHMPCEHDCWAVYYDAEVATLSAKVAALSAATATATVAVAA